MNSLQGTRTGRPLDEDHRDPTLREVALRAGGILLITGGCVLTVAIGRSAPIRVVLSLTFLLFGPGLALTELLQIRSLPQRLALATGASLSVDTLVASALVYARAFSMPLAIAILAAVTVSAVGWALLRAHHAQLRPDHRSPPAA